MNKSDIKAKVDDIVQQIILKYKPDEIRMYGSFARGSFTEDSDLDLCVIKSGITESGIQRRWELRKLVKKNNIPVDYIVLSKKEFKDRLKKNDPFLSTILREGKILYSQEKNA